MKDYRHIDEMLNRYWQCETSVKEEKTLQDFFLNEQNIPPHLIQYQSLFEYRSEKQAEKLSDDFDKKILNQINPKRKRFYLRQVMAVAASIAIFIGVGFTMHLHQARTEQVQARETVLDALFMISDNLQQGEELILRGLEAFEIAIQ
ncbi:MAG: hypothetical protein LBI15_01105 [Dysgonamonadaceae bacterium]|jgi:hypothetical protein|nr:hypothetical protein [Dysgonamonadaceae bacterium]